MRSCISSALNRADKLVESTMSQKRTLSSLRSGPGSPAGSAVLGSRSPIADDLWALLLRLELGFRRLGLTQLRDGRKHDLAVTKRDAEFLQIGAVQVRQGAKVDIVLGKDLGIFAQTETVQPILNRWHARLRFPQFASAGTLRFPCLSC